MKKLILVLLSATVLLSAATTDAKAEKDVLATLEAWKQAAIHKDRAGLEKIYHSELKYGHSNGLIENKAAAIKHIVDSKGAYEAIDFADTTVTVLGNTALATGKVLIHEKAADGKKVDVNLVVMHVFVKSPQGWLMVGRQATRPTP